jgi:hypothetical protein
MIDVPSLVQEIRHQHRLREDFLGAEKRLTLQIKALCRRVCGGDKTEAAVVYKALEKGDLTDDRAAKMIGLYLTLQNAREEIKKQRKHHEKLLVTVVKDLPVYGWMESVRGFGPLGLAQIVGEAEDLSRYANPSKLWKRMGVGRFEHDGEWLTQRRYSNKAKAVAAGYSPRRRSILFSVGDAIVKVGKGGPYRELYDAKKIFYREKWPDTTPMHVHRAAQRYMEKRLLRDLWREWRKTSPSRG